jgi:hypothetical protein
MGDGKEDLQRREAADRRAREEVVLDEETAAGWLDREPSGSERRPSADDLPDNPPPPAPASIFSRILRALRGS